MSGNKALQAVLGAPLTQGASAYIAQTASRNAAPADVNVAEVTQEQADIRDKTSPAFFSEVVPAAFSEHNLTAGIIDSLSKKHTIDLNYDKPTALKELTKGIPEDYLKNFTGMSYEEDARILQDVQHQIKANNILQQSGFIGMLTDGAAMLLDPVGIAMFGTEAKLLSKVLTKGERVTNALWHGVASAGTMTAYTDALKRTHGSEMDGKDMLYAALGGGLVGGVLGALSKGGAAASTAFKDTASRVQAQMDKNLVEELGQGIHRTGMTREEALTRAAEEPLPEFTAISRPKEAAKAEALRKDILAMQAARTEDRAAVAAEHGAPGSKSRAEDLTTQVNAADQYTPLIEAAQTKLDALELRLGDTSIQKAQHLNKRADEILKQNTKLAEKPKPTFIPQEVLPESTDNSISMFDKAIANIKESWDRAAKNDGSTSGMFIPFEGGSKPKLKGQFSDLGDKQAKVELSDYDSSLNYNKMNFGDGKQVITTLGELLDHPKLYKADPSLMDIKIVLNKEFTRAGTDGNYIANLGDNPPHIKGDTIVINGVGDKIRYGDTDKTLLHEIQHAVQNRNQFAHGAPAGSEKYMQSAGEDEARRVTAHKDTKQKDLIGNPYKDSTVKDPSKLVTQVNYSEEPMDMFVHTPKGVEQVATETANAESILKEFSVQEGASAALKYTAEANVLAKSGVFDALSKGIGRVQTILGKAAASDSSYMLSSKSNEAKKFVHDLMENGTGVMHNAGNAAIKKIHYITKLMSDAAPEFQTFSRSWRQENNKLGWKHTLWDNSWVDDMYKELRTEMEMRSNAHFRAIEHESPHSLHTQRMADALDKANAQALTLMKRTGVYGAAEITARSGYTMLLWSGRKIRELHQTKGLFEKFSESMSSSYVEATGMPLSDARKVTKAVLLRAKNNDLGIDSNPHALLSRDSREFLRETLRNSDSMTEEEMNSLFSRIDASMDDKGASSRIKRRTNIDLLAGFEHEGKQHSILDLVDNDMQMMHRRYMEEISGRSALAAKGLASEGAWTAQRSAILEGMSNAGDDIAVINHAKDIIAGTYNQLLGRPVGSGVNRHARRFMDLSGLSMLAQAGTPQIAEFSQLMGEHGLASMWNVLPAVKAFRQSIKNGTVSADILSDLAPWTGRIWDEHILFSAKLRLEDALGSDPAWLKKLDRLTANAKDFSGYASGMYSIRRLQQQMNVALQANKMAEALRGVAFSADGYKFTGKFAGQEARLASVGWDKEFMQQMKSVEKHFEWEGNTLQRLNMHKWNDPLLMDKFIEGIHKHTHTIIQKPLVGETRVWMHSTIGSMLTQFRNYPLVGIEKQTMHQIHMGDSNAVWTGMYGLGMSSLVYSVKSALGAQGKSDKDKQAYLDKRFSPSGMFKGALAYASIMSVTQEGLNILGAFGLAPEAMISQQTTRNGGSRGVNISLKDIPSLGFATNALNAVGSVTKTAVDPTRKWSKSDSQAWKGITPLGTAHGMVQMLNVMDDELRD